MSSLEVQDNIEEMMQQEDVKSEVHAQGAVNNKQGKTLTETENDAIGEISNICMGTSATTLSTLLGKRVSITTPKVSIHNSSDYLKEYNKPLVMVDVTYTQGVDGYNVLLLKEEDVIKSVREMIDNNIINEEEYQKIDILDVLKCLNSSIIKYAAGKKIIREKSFIYNIRAKSVIDTDSNDLVLLQGTVDMVIFGEKIILVDYKASRKTKEEIIKSYKKQMDLYALVVEGIYKKKVDKKIIYVFNQNLEIEIN
jgi:hypothetical protein